MSFSLLTDGAVESTALSPAALTAAFRKQASIRVAIGSPIVLYGLWAAGQQQYPLLLAAFLASSHLLYMATAWSLARASAQIPMTLVRATAIADPVFMSGWLVITDDWGAIFLGFYLFTTLGYGFRMGISLMRICQVTSIGGFVAVFALAPYWQTHVVAWLAFLLPLFFVPAYARSLIAGLHQARASAEHASEAKSNMLAKVSHELRTPLNGIMASTELLEEYIDGPAPTALLATVKAASKGLLREINHLLDLRKLESNAICLEKRPFQPSDVLRQVHLTLRTAAASKGLQFEVICTGDEKCAFVGDPYYLQQILVNLVGNAIKFTQQGFVRLTANATELQKDTFRWHFSIKDSGIGIPPEMLARIFEPFVQAEASTTRRYGGTGLGTSIAKQLVELMGGKLQVQSVLGTGSEFYFDVVLHVAPSDSLQTAGAPTTTDFERRGSAVKRLRILVADDNQSNLQIIRAMLEKDEHRVLLAGDGETTLAALGDVDFDLVLMDYNLGGITGLEVMKAYKMGRIRTAPVLFVTADATTETSRLLIDAGAAGVLTKPLSISSLRDAIASAYRGDARVETTVSVNTVEQRPSLSLVEVDPLDRNTLDRLRNISPDPGFFPKLVAHSAKEIAQFTRESQIAAKANDLAKLRFAAHTLKGVSHNVGAVRLSALAFTLMSLSALEPTAQLDRILNDLNEECGHALHALQAIVEECALS